MLVVTTFRFPHRGAAGAAPPRLPPPPRPASHVATEYPCNVLGVPAGTVVLKWSKRVCVPASMSIFRVLSSTQLMFNLPGTRILPPAPYTLHGSGGAAGAAGTGAPAAGAPPLPAPPPPPPPRPPRRTPEGGESGDIRSIQSSVTMETQVPVRSTGAPPLAPGAAAGAAPPPCPRACAAAPPA